MSVDSDKHNNNTRYSTVNVSNNNTSYKPYLKIDGNIKEQIHYVLENSLILLNANDTKKQYYQTDIRIRYLAKNKRYEYFIEGVDILNFNSSTVESQIVDNIQQTTIYTRLPGFIGLGLKLYL